MTKNLQIRWKIIIPIALVSILGAFGSYFYTSQLYEESEIKAYITKANTITTAAEGARDFSAMQNDAGIFKDSLTNEDDILKTVPIVAAMELARSKAEELGFDFKVPAGDDVQPVRNPDNEPSDFEKMMLGKLRSQFTSDNSKNSMYEIYTENGVEKLRYFKAIALSEDCMKCHGQPSDSYKYWGRNDGKDITGARMEGMKVGYMKGAFEVSMDMAPVREAVDSASMKILGISLGVGLLITLLALLVANTISSPIKDLSVAAENIANGKLNEEIFFDRGDEIGTLGDSFEKVRTNLNQMIDGSKKLSHDIVNGQLMARIDVSNQNGSYKDLLNGFNEVANANTGILDNAANVMVASSDGIIRYMNGNLKVLLSANEAEMKKIIPSFDMSTLIGTNIDNFHRNPAHQRGILDNLKDTHKAIINVGKLAFRLAITPVFDNSGNRTAFIVVWENYTFDNIFQTELKGVIDDIKSGDLNSRMNTSQLNETFAKISDNINLMLEGVAAPFMLTSNYLNQISIGNMPELIDNTYEGEYYTIIENINKVINTLNLFISEMNNMAQKHDEGFISVVIDADKFDGAYNQMANGVIDMVNGHIDTKKKAISVVEAFGKGDFDADIERLPNEKVFINNALDAVRNNLKNFQSEVQLLIDSAKNGELQNRGKAGKFEGEWSGLVGGLNQILEAIVEPIDESSMILDKMSNGVFTEKMTGSYSGDFNTLKQNINSVVDSLSTLLGQLQDSINTTAATANELSATSESMASASAEQSAQTDEVASAMEEMSHTISENARSSQETSQVATGNGESARKGGEIVKETITKMKDIAEVVSNSTTSVSELGQSSKEIGEIVSVIDEIAEQTNMLALNAAIEAARAGEQGRGFAVVADEVRKLAERTGEATKRISKMISSIQIKTGEAVDAMNKGKNEVDAGIKLADEAGESLNNILENAQNVLNMINQIAAASEEQSATSEEISKNIASISSVTSEYSKKVQDISYSAEDLSKLTNNLEMLVGKFQFDNTGSSKMVLEENTSENPNKKLLN